MAGPEEAVQKATAAARGGLTRELAENNLEMLGPACLQRLNSRELALNSGQVMSLNLCWFFRPPPGSRSHDRPITRCCIVDGGDRGRLGNEATGGALEHLRHLPAGCVFTAFGCLKRPGAFEEGSTDSTEFVDSRL